MTRFSKPTQQQIQSATRITIEYVRSAARGGLLVKYADAYAEALAFIVECEERASEAVERFNREMQEQANENKRGQKA